MAGRRDCGKMSYEALSREGCSPLRHRGWPWWGRREGHGLGTWFGSRDAGGRREAEGAASLDAANPPLAALGTLAGISYSPLLLPSALWFATAGAPCSPWRPVLSPL